MEITWWAILRQSHLESSHYISSLNAALRRGVGQEGMAARLVLLMGRKVLEKFPEIGGRDVYFGF